MINIYLSSSRAQGRNEVESQHVGSGSHCWQQCFTHGIKDQADDKNGFRHQNSHRLWDQRSTFWVKKKKWVQLRQNRPHYNPDSAHVNFSKFVGAIFLQYHSPLYEHSRNVLLPQFSPLIILSNPV